MTTKVFEGEVPSAFLEEVEDRVKRMVKRCARRGMPAPRLTVGKPFIKSVWTEERDPEGNHIHKQVEYVPVTIEAEPLRINGWRLVGVVTPALKDNHAVPLLTAAPGESVADVRTDDPFRCEHCNRADLSRKETFIVRHEDGTVKQVGRQCLRDFLGHDPANLIAYSEWLADLFIDEDTLGGWAGSAPRLYPIADVIRAAARVVTKVGFYVSRAKAEESIYESDDEVERWRAAGSPDSWVWKHRALQSTSSETKWVLDPPSGLKANERPAYVYPENNETDTLVEDTMAGLDEMRKKDAKGDWEWSLEQATSVDAVQMRNVGVVASAVILGMRRQEWRAREREAREEAKRLKAEHPQEYIGKVGERLRDVPAEVTFMREFQNSWGGFPSTLVRLLAEQGTIVWWASNLSTHRDAESGDYVPDLKVGDKVTITGTVKKHEPDRLTGLPTTVITRCKYEVTKGADE